MLKDETFVPCTKDCLQTALDFKYLENLLQQKLEVIRQDQTKFRRIIPLESC